MPTPDFAPEALPLRRPAPRGACREGRGGDAGPTTAARRCTLLRSAPPRTVALDIETTGLSRHRDAITVVCVYGNLDAGRGVSHATFNFLEGEAPKKAEKLAKILDAAERISCFNGTRFDIPFLQTALAYDPERVGRWVYKMFDVFDIAKGALRATFKLDTALYANGIRCKSASGMQAVEWAANPRDWPKLEAYCLQDTRLTYELSQLPVIRLPASHPRGVYHIVQDGADFTLEVLRVQ